MRAIIVFSWALVASPVHAQADTVEELVAEGIELRVQGHDAAALERFRKAAELAPMSARVQGHLALALHAQGHWIESEHVMLGVLGSPNDDWVARHAEELRHSLAAVQAHLGWLEIDAPEPAEVWLDEQSVGTVPLRAPLRVTAGDHSVSLRASGRAPLQKTVSIPAGRHLYLALTDTTAHRQSASPPVPSPRTPERQGTQAPRTGGVKRTLGTALLGAGAASIVAGTILGINAVVLRGERNRECDQTGCSYNGIVLDARARQSAEYSNISFVAGLAGLGIGTVLVW